MRLQALRYIAAVRARERARERDRARQRAGSTPGPVFSKVKLVVCIEHFYFRDYGPRSLSSHNKIVDTRYFFL